MWKRIFRFLFCCHSNCECCRVAVIGYCNCLLADLLRRAGIAVEDTPDMTNMVFFPLGEGDVSDAEFEKRCLDKGMLIHMVSPRRARFVTHMDVDREDVERAAAIVAEVIRA